MALFKNAHDSHRHSMEMLDMIYGYDSFLDNISTVADMGCGHGLDTEWWATLYTRDDPPEPRNFLVYAVDQNIDNIDADLLAANPNIVPIKGNFEDRIIPRQVDIIWSHDSLQYARDPLSTLKVWKNTLNVNGMLMLVVPQTTYIQHNRLIVSNHSHQYYSYNILNLMYLLALSGFDTRDAYFYRKENSPWLYAGVYASDYDPVSDHASWYDLVERNLVNESVAASVHKFGYARLEDVVVQWFDKSLYQISN